VVRRKKWLCLWFLGSLIGGCGGTQRDDGSKSVYLKYAPSSLRVGQIHLKYTIDIDKDIGYLVDSKLPPSVMLSQWVKDQFIASGTQGALFINVEKMSLLSHAQENSRKGWFSFLKADEGGVFQGEMVIRLTWKSGLHQKEMRVSVSAKRQVSKELSLKERKVMLQAVTSDLIDQAQGRIQDYLKSEWSGLVF
jgi:hypothetical protein